MIRHLRHVIMAMTLAAQGCLADNYYVSSIDPNSSDSGPGTLSQPWKTLAPVGSHSFAAGDTITFEKGSSWTGGFRIRSSGQAGKPIVLTSYATNTAMPSFQSRSTAVVHGDCIRIPGSYLVVENLYFHNCVAAGTNDARGVRNLGAIYIETGANNVIVRQCEMNDCPVGIKTCGQHGLFASNYIHDCTRFLSDPNWGPVGIMISASHNEASYNRIRNYVVSGGTWGADGGAFELDVNSRHHIYLHHNITSGNCGFCECTKGACGDNTFAYNCSDDYQEFIFFWAGDHSVVENNTVVCVRPRISITDCVFTFGGGVTNTIRNNIIVVGNHRQAFAGTGQLWGNGGNYALQEHDHNLYWCSDGNVRDAIGIAAGPGEITGDPLFANWTNRDLHLTQESPAVDAGVPVGSTTDLDGHPVPSGSAPDLGAYEYNNTRANDSVESLHTTQAARKEGR